jgi:hypothetical protein
MRILAILLLSTLFMAPSPSADAQMIPADGRLDFAIVRAGEEIGFHRFVFRRDGDRLVVEIEVQAQVRVLGITVFRFSQHATETWRGGRLVALDSVANNDGTNHVLRVHEGDGGLIAEGDGRIIRHPADAIPTDLWHRGQLERRTLLHSLDGSAAPTTVRDLGERTIMVRGAPVTAHGAFIDARPDYQRELWYDPSGQLVYVAMRGRDGSEVVYRLR